MEISEQDLDPAVQTYRELTTRAAQKDGHIDADTLREILRATIQAAIADAVHAR